MIGFLLILLLSLSVSVHGQLTGPAVPAEAVPDGSPQWSPMPPTACATQDECNMMSLPCEVRLCQSGKCDFQELRPRGQMCGGVRNTRDVCNCDGVEAHCICDVTSKNDFELFTGSDTGTGTVAGMANSPTSSTTSPAGAVRNTLQVMLATTTTTSSSSTTTQLFSFQTGMGDNPGTAFDPLATTTDAGMSTSRLMATRSTSTTQSKHDLTKPTSATGTVIVTQLPTDEIDVHDNGEEQPPIQIIVGAVVGCIALVCLIAIIAYLLSRRSRESTPTSLPPAAIQSSSSSSPSSSMTMTTSPMTFSHVPSGTSEYGAAPAFPPSGEYGVAPPQQLYDAPPTQMFADYESVRDPLQL
jgi:hypothetical protein